VIIVTLLRHLRNENTSGVYNLISSYINNTMKRVTFIILFFAIAIQPNLQAQEEDKEEKAWDIGGALGVDFSQLLFVNPKVGAGENRIGIGGNTSFYANYQKGRITWNNKAGLAFGVQRLGRGPNIPFQKSVDELRIGSDFSYSVTEKSPFGYSLDFLLLSQITPTYDGNFLTRDASSTISHPIAKFFSPATITVSPGISFLKKTDFGTFSALLSPASLKMTIVADDSIAMLGQHGNPHGTGVTEQEFIDNWRVKPDGQVAGGYYAHNYIQFGATFKAGYKHKLWKYKEGDKDKHRLILATNVTLYSNYMREPQNIDVEWITTVDLYLFKGLSLSLLTNLFYDHDVLVQVDRDGDINTGTNGYESTGRRVSFMQQLLIKYNFLF